MTHVISEEKAFKIVQEFLTDILQISQDVLALYVIGSLGGGYYRPGQSDIDTAVIVRDNAAVTQEEIDQIAESYGELSGKISCSKGIWRNSDPQLRTAASLHEKRNG